MATTSSNLIAIGDHPARAVMPTDPALPFVRWGRTQSKDPKCSITMEITDGPFKGRRIPFEGFFTPLKPGARKSGTDMAFEALRNMGWTGDEVADIVDPKDLPGVVSIKVAHEDFEVDVEVDGYMEKETRTVAKIQYVNPLGGRDKVYKDAVVGDELRALSARLKSAAAARPAQARGASTSAGGNRRRADEPDLNGPRSAAPPRDDGPPANPWDLTDDPEPGSFDEDLDKGRDPHGDGPPPDPNADVGA